MPANPFYLFQGQIHLEKSDYQLYCKVTGENRSENDGRPYVLLIPGGPGYDHLSMQATYDAIISSLSNEKMDLPHFIFFDPLSCGQSEQSKNPETEYTIDYFTEIAAQLIEAVQIKLDRASITGTSAG